MTVSKIRSVSDGSAWGWGPTHINKMMGSARTGELVMAAALLAAGIFFVWQSLLLPFGDLGLPGPGFFPFVLGIVLGLVALALVIGAVLQLRARSAPRGQLGTSPAPWIQRPEGATRGWGPALLNNGDQAEAISLGHRDILIVFAALVGVGLFFEPLGTYVTLGLFTAALLLLVAGTSPWRAVLGACLGMVAVWVFFNVLLGVQLPAGPF